MIIFHALKCPPVYRAAPVVYAPAPVVYVQPAPVVYTPEWAWMVSAEFFRALRRRSAADRQEDARGALLTFRLLW